LTSPPPCDILISKEAQAMTKIDLITGILGSGKTTFLMKYARHLIDSGQKIAILENDFGAVNIDMMILQELRCDSCQLEMIAGGAAMRTATGAASKLSSYPLVCSTLTAL